MPINNENPMAADHEYQVSWWRTSFGDDEVDRLKEAVANENISQGTVTEELESRLAEALDVPYVVATTSGSVALLLALMALGIGRDDEVIIPDRTWIATAHAAAFLGAKVVLVDVVPNHPSMDVTQIRQKITNRTKAILPVHLNGRSNDMEEINAIAREHGLIVVEDACQALFSKNSAGYLGTQSDAGCFSLGVTKLISTGQGGFITTKNPSTYESLKLVRNHGVVDNFTDTWNQMGFNFKFTDLLASFGLVQLSKAADRINRVKQIYTKYVAAFDESTFYGVKLIPVDVSAGELPLYVEALCDNRDGLICFLKSKGIQARPSPPSLHTSDYLDNKGEYPRSDVFAEQGLYLPCGPEQPMENIDSVLDALRGYGRGR